MSGRIEIVNWYVTRKHYADLTSAQRGVYVSLCGKASGCKTPEEDATYREKRGWPAKDYALPLCKFCERKAQAESERETVINTIHVR